MTWCDREPRAELVISPSKTGGLRYNGFPVNAVAGENELAKLGRYELITQIGQGGMAEVQLALQRGPAGFEKLVVVKLVHANLAKQKTFVDMLLDEARVAALVKHPNVVDIYDLGEAEGRYFIAMEYLEGEPLLGLLRAGREGKRLDALSTARLIADTAEGLDAAHELQSIGGDPMELVHHDVSLGNIMVLYNGQVKLVDFGVAKASETAGPQMKVHGKFGYMAPEKLKGRGSDRRGDIWSLGVVLWEALTLRRLFRGTSEQDTMRMVLEHPIQRPSVMCKESPAELDEIVMRALERDPARRYARAKDLAADLEEVLRQQAYGGRNELISRYMQATFSAHITARKRLLQEVMQKGKASAAVLSAAFDEGPAKTPRAGRPSGEFSIAFRGTQTPIPRSSGRMAVVTDVGDAERTPIQELAESSQVAEILNQRRTSEEMMAEGTPHSVVTAVPRRVTKQMFAEATPVQTDPDSRAYVDPEDYDRKKYPRADTRAATEPAASRVGSTSAEVMALVDSMKPVEQDDAAVLAMVATLEPPKLAPALIARPGASAPPPMSPMSPMPPPPAPPVEGALADMLDNAVVEIKLDDKLDDATKRDLEQARSSSLSHGISSMLDRWEETVAPATLMDIPQMTDDAEDPSQPIAPRTTSRQMLAQAAPRPTSRKLEIIAKPKTQRMSIAEPIAIVVDTPRRGTTILIIVLTALIAVGIGIALLLL
jgi:serine/threonine protein kinase